MKQKGANKTEDVDNQLNNLFRNVLIDDLMTREARASVALDHDPQYQTYSMPDEYSRCSIIIIEFLELGAVFLAKDESGGFIEGGLGIVNLDDYNINKVAELAYCESAGVLHVRYRFPNDNACMFFSTNEKWVVWL